MNIRLQRMQSNIHETEIEDIKVLSDIVSGWINAYKKGGWKNLQVELSKEVEDDQGKKRPILEEDLENLGSLATDEYKRLQERGQDFEFLGQEINRVTKIINNMRSLARVGGERKRINIHIPLEDTIATLSDILEKERISLIRTFHPTDSNYEIVADKDELVQVFSNIIRNAIQAIKSTKKEDGKIFLSTQVENGRVEVRIKDSGSGIAQEHIAKVFESTFTTKTIVDGTGLGLSISRRLIRAFNGDIEVESSAIGKGTTFKVWLPQAEV